jgi:hypothetical protein
MTELYTLFFLVALLALSFWMGSALPLSKPGSTGAWQLSILLLNFLFIYGAGLSLFHRLYRRWRPKVLRPGQSGSLAWKGHLILALIWLLGLSLLLNRSTIHPFHLAMLGLGSIISLGTFALNWREWRRPPRPARDLSLTPGPGFIDLTWTPPDGPRTAEYLLVRCSPNLMPAYPEQGQILCRGIWSAWRDETVEPGRTYAYIVFTHDGCGRYRSTPGQLCTALSVPLTPLNLTCTPEPHTIQLSWWLLDRLNLQTVCIIRRAVGPDQKRAENRIELQLCEKWRDDGLAPETSYEYKVQTVDAWGQQSEPAYIQATTLTEPLAVRAANIEEESA